MNNILLCQSIQSLSPDLYILLRIKTGSTYFKELPVIKGKLRKRLLVNIRQHWKQLNNIMKHTEYAPIIY